MWYNQSMTVYMDTVLVNKSYKVELKSNNKQRTAFLQAAGTARFAYNWALQTRNDHYEKTGKRLSGYDLSKKLNSTKKQEFPWMYDSSAWVVKNAIYNLDNAFKQFFRRLREGQEDPGFPQYKSKNKGIGSFSINQRVQVQNNKVYLEKIGWVRIKNKKFSIPEDVKILGVTVSEKNGRWYASIKTRQEIEMPENGGSTIGADLGLKSWVTTSEGEQVDLPVVLKKEEKKEKRLQRNISRKKNGSKNRTKAKNKYGRYKERLANRRKDQIHKTTTYLAKNHSLVGIEDLNVSGMLKNKSLARKISESNWYMFRDFLAYKCEWYGSQLIAIDRFFPSTKMCSWCKAIKDMPLSERIYNCDKCGLSLDRDVNAAMNIGNEATATVAESYVSGEGEVADSSESVPFNEGEIKQSIGDKS